MAYGTPPPRVNFKNKYGDSLTTWIYAKFPEVLKTPMGITYDNNYIRLGNTAYEKRGLDVVKQRDVTVTIFNIATYDLQYDLLINYIIAFFREDSPYYMEDLVTEKRFRVSLDDFKVKEEKGYEKRFGELTLNLSLQDSFPEKLNSTSNDGSLISGGSFTVELPVYASETPFQLTLTNATGANSDFFIELSNRDLSGSMQISEIGFVSGTQIVIDSLEGTCTLLPDGINIKKSISDGTFFLLRKGTNSIFYKSLSGTPLTYEISYRMRTAV